MCSDTWFLAYGTTTEKQKLVKRRLNGTTKLPLDAYCWRVPEHGSQSSVTYIGAIPWAITRYIEDQTQIVEDSLSVTAWVGVCCVLYLVIELAHGDAAGIPGDEPPTDDVTEIEDPEDPSRRRCFCAHRRHWRRWRQKWGKRRSSWSRHHFQVNVDYRKPYTVYWMVPLSMTFEADFKSRHFRQ